jgi:hypothetical protein
MDVVEREYERPGPSEVLEQGAHRAVGAITLLLECDGSSTSER